MNQDTKEWILAFIGGGGVSGFLGEAAESFILAFIGAMGVLCAKLALNWLRARFGTSKSKKEINKRSGTSE